MQLRNFFVFNRDLDVGTVLTVPYLKIRKIINFAFCGHQILDIELIKKIENNEVNWILYSNSKKSRQFNVGFSWACFILLK